MAKQLPPFVLIQETIDKFGYDPTQLVGRDTFNYKIIVTCFDCNNIYEQSIASALTRFKKNKKCKFCANKERALNQAKSNSIRMKEHFASGEYIHPMLGKNHTQESKDKMSKSTLGITLEQKVGKEKADKLKLEASIRFSGSGNPFFGKQHPPEIQAYINSVLLKNVRRGKESNFYGKKYWPDRKLFKHNGISYRSGWEVKTAKYFESNNIHFTFENKIFELGNTTYTPDFYLIDENKWIEVKGYWYDDAREKFECFKIAYPEINIEVWEKDKLKSLGII